MAVLIAPSGTVCTVDDSLAERLLEQGFKEQAKPKPARPARASK